MASSRKGSSRQTKPKLTVVEVCRTKTNSCRYATIDVFSSHPQLVHSIHNVVIEEREPHFVVSLLRPYVCRYEKSYVVSAMMSAVVWPGAILSVSGSLLLDFENQWLNGLRYMLQEAKPKRLVTSCHIEQFFFPSGKNILSYIMPMFYDCVTT